MSQTVEIRLELLKKQGEGYSKAETVKHLVEKFGITRQGGYYHFETLDTWSSQYLDFENIHDFQFNILNQLNTINREASFQYLTAHDDNAKIGYLRTRLTALDKLAEYAGLNADKVIDPQTGKVVHLHMWRPGDVPIDSIELTWKKPKWMKSREELDLSKLTAEEKEVLDQAARIFAKQHDKIERSRLH